MSYQVLARKWRPQIFNDVIGQKYILTALITSLQQQRLHHAYLFSGTRGIGKTTISRLFAKGLNCKLGITANPCCKCINCIEITQGRFIDLLEIDAASRTKVEDTRELLDNVQYLPLRGRYKVYLIDEVHMLSRYSFNALLKTLEEPPEHVKFLLATTDPQKIPITVLSRCIQFHLKQLNISEISNHVEYILINEKILTDHKACELIAISAQGSLRDALSLTERAIVIGQGKEVSEKIVIQMLGILDITQLCAILEAIVAFDGNKVMKILENMDLQDYEWENFLIEILSLLHRISMIQILSKKIVKDNQIQQDYHYLIEKRLHFFAHIITPSMLQFYYHTFLIGRKELPYAPNKRIGVEMILLRAIILRPK